MSSVNELRQRVAALEETIRNLRLVGKTEVADTLEAFSRRIKETEKKVAAMLQRVEASMQELSAVQEQHIDNLQLAWQQVKKAVEQAEQLVDASKQLAEKVDRQQVAHRDDIQRLLGDLGVVTELRAEFDEFKKKVSEQLRKWVKGEK